jgi:excisionase family DNA binding protein
MAKLLQVSRGQIYKLAKSTIPSFHLGTSVRFDPHSVAKWLREEA